jgi:hypothetical protein
MFDYTINVYELQNLLQRGEIDRDDLTPEQLEELDRMEAETDRAEYASAYASYVHGW